MTVYFMPHATQSLSIATCHTISCSHPGNCCNSTQSAMGYHRDGINFVAACPTVCYLLSYPVLSVAACCIVCYLLPHAMQFATCYCMLYSLLFVAACHAVCYLLPHAMQFAICCCMPYTSYLLPHAVDTVCYLLPHTM